METDTNPPTEPTHGRETDGWRQTRKPGTKSETVICPGEQDRVNPGPAPPPTGPVEGCEEPRDKKSRSRSLARMSASATPTPELPGRQQVLHKEDTERQHECTEPKGHKTDRFVTESQHPRAQAYGARRRLRSTIPPSRYNLWQ